MFRYFLLQHEKDRECGVLYGGEEPRREVGGGGTNAPVNCNCLKCVGGGGRGGSELMIIGDRCVRCPLVVASRKKKSKEKKMLKRVLLTGLVDDSAAVLSTDAVARGLLVRPSRLPCYWVIPSSS